MFHMIICDWCHKGISKILLCSRKVALGTMHDEHVTIPQHHAAFLESEGKAEPRRLEAENV